MARFGQAMKDRVLGRLLPPQSAAIEEVSREVGISVDTLERWRAEAVIAAAAMDEAQCSGCAVSTGCIRANWRAGG